MNQCHRCEHWNKGRGTKACLSCQIYKTIQKQSVKRKTVKYDVYPDEILESFANPEPEEYGLFEKLQDLPEIQWLVMSNRYIRRLTIAETAEKLGISTASVVRYSDAAKRALRKMA